MQITTQQMLKILYWISLTLLIGICFEAGGFLFNTFYTLAINPIDAQHFWPRVDLSSLYSYDRGYFAMETLVMCFVGVLRAWIFFLIVQLLQENKLNMFLPFNNEVGRFMFRISWLALLTGLFSWWGTKYAEWFVKQGVKMPEVQYLRIGGADVWLFMGVVLYVLAQMFKRGIEIQSENELTV